MNHSQPDFHPGMIEVYFGCMFSGKTEALIRRIQDLSFGQRKISVFSPQSDLIAPGGNLHTHSGWILQAESVSGSTELNSRVGDSDEFVVVDEAQFFDEQIVEATLSLAQRGKHVLIAGLDLDFRGVPFGSMSQLIACATKLHKLNARCSICSLPAHFTQRLVDGRPATYYERIILPGGSELYQPRCYRHHFIPGRHLDHTPKETSTIDWRILDWISRLRSTAQTGLNFSESIYERERYGALLSIVEEMGLHLGEFAATDVITIAENTGFEGNGYVTPKTAVAMAVFDEAGSMLLVQRSDNKGWAFPGGWADVGLTPSENAANEVYEETGLHVECEALVGVYDTRLHRIGQQNEPAYTLLFRGMITRTDLCLHRTEILDARFFEPHSLPPLDPGAAAQARDALSHRNLSCPTRYD